MATEKVRELGPHKQLVRDARTGIAWIEDSSTGLRHSVHPNISASGSARGMKDKRCWDRDDVTVHAGGFIYNISRLIDRTDTDRAVAAECRCGGAH
ncbi:Uncharacterised protein (plasmid) [Tsukamurella tyrosinosolvens]|uniref:Uncharacterized protein n=1 Tax=Tsukamurella tyrosinosolvens TaxID=57704 RepID=A0A1H4V5T2_TSUTY|nr:hypothetical protein [Tsukamurella tyrosinosolvens]SEC76462.1 hypothetical protein SAMN04489793_3154 [Tsukamurella tyrosinosolvens]VEH90662.1 Uncharacterised protein [Tsukamurella tyrosinosolvens]